MRNSTNDNDPTISKLIDYATCLLLHETFQACCNILKVKHLSVLTCSVSSQRDESCIFLSREHNHEKAEKSLVQ